MANSMVKLGAWIPSTGTSPRFGVQVNVSTLAVTLSVPLPDITFQARRG